MSLSITTILIPLFFITAIFYSMVGFGGGSTYLALLALMGVAYTVMPSTALLCNIIVVTGGCYFFFKNKSFSLKCILPFLILSLPMAYIGGRLSVNKTTFFILLGFALLTASLRMLFATDKFKEIEIPTWHKAWLVGLPLGGLMGFLSGVTGIGGGIFLAPILYFLRWGKAKTIAASASLFILTNSIAGLMGQLVKNSFKLDWSLIFPLAIAVMLGGQIGSRLAVEKINKTVMMKLTAYLILFVALRIFWQLF